MSNLRLSTNGAIRRVMLALASVAFGMTVPFVISGSSTSVETITQVTGSGRISGSVRTQDGRKLPAAIVVVAMSDGRAPRVTKTNAAGGFIFLGLSAGSYVMQGCT